MDLINTLLNNPVKFSERAHREKLVIMMCWSGIILISPFIFIRYFNGEYNMAIIDFTLIIGLILLGRHIWFTREVEQVCTLISSLCTMVVIGIIFIKGIDLVYWSYPTMMANFFLIARRPAMILNGALLSSIALTLVRHPVLLESILIFCTVILLFIMGLVVTSIIGNQQLRLSRLATHDVLTGAMNRRSLDETLNNTARDKLHHNYNAAMMLDLDHFKQINDTFGHAAGDKVLKGTAALIEKLIDGRGTLYRYGGEEFTVLCQQQSMQDSLALAEDIRKQLEESGIFAERQITVSIGLAELSSDAEPQTALKHADEALYNAKQSGRNRVAVYEAPEPDLSTMPSRAAQPEMSLVESA